MSIPTAQAYIYYSTDFSKLRTSLLMNQHVSAMTLTISTNGGDEVWEWSLPSWAGVADQVIEWPSSVAGQQGILLVNVGATRRLGHLARCM